jgi:hypothetical protein
MAILGAIHNITLLLIVYVRTQMKVLWRFISITIEHGARGMRKRLIRASNRDDVPGFASGKNIRLTKQQCAHADCDYIVICERYQKNILMYQIHDQTPKIKFF